MNVAVYFMRLRVKALRDLERIANTVLQPPRHTHTQTPFDMRVGLKMQTVELFFFSARL